MIELRSASVREASPQEITLTSLQEKMQEYIENGAWLGLLIDRKNRTVHVSRPGRSPELLENPDVVSCEPELLGVVLQMAKIW